MGSSRLRAAVGSAAILLCAIPAGAFAQTTMAPTPAPVIGPTMAATRSPMTGASTAPTMTSTHMPMAAPSGGAMTMPMPAGITALDARNLRARRTSTGYTLTGQALVNDACQAARFDQYLGNIFPPFFNLDQFRDPKKMSMMCVQRLTWVTAQPRAVTSTYPPKYVSVHTKKGTQRIPVR